VQKAIVIGAGIAGLAASVRLKRKGYDVNVFEANAYAGGKLHAFESKGYQFDYGPSLFTMPQYVEELFHINGLDPKEHFTYHRKDNICNYFWDDGVEFSAKSDPENFIREALTVFNEDEKQIRAYLKNSAEKYDKTENLFLNKSLHKLKTYLTKDTIKGLLAIPRLDLLKSLNGIFC
jgi:phytoene dehydrogenase-like protein